MRDNQARLDYIKKFADRPVIYSGTIGKGKTERKIYVTSGNQPISPDSSFAKLFIECYLEAETQENINVDNAEHA